MPVDFADQAFGHCLAVLRDHQAAADAATAALRRAGRSRSSVLAHARFQALEHPEPAAPSSDTRAPDDLTELAALLGATKPAIERALLDLRFRLDRAELGRALGMPAAAAAERADAIGEAWDRDLDPLLMARLGPGDCLALAAVLADADLTHPTLGDLHDIGPAVAAHVAGCPMCTDRHRAMVSVRSLLAQADAGPTPESVRDAARRSRRMRPAAAPPPLYPHRRRPVLIGVAVLGVVLLVGGVATAAAMNRSTGGRDQRVAQLVQLPPGARLGLTIRRDTVEITNRSSGRLKWRATAEAPWLQVRPDQGELAAGQTQALTTRVLPTSPEGALHTTVTVTGEDGSAAAAVYETNVERPPDIGATADGCSISATVEDVSGVATVALHWADKTGTHQMTMTPGPAGYTATLPAATPLTWWVAAADTRGNQARTPEAKTAC